MLPKRPGHAHLRVTSWHPPAPPPTFEQGLSLAVSPFVTGWNRAIARPPEIRITRHEVAGPAPRVISIKIRDERVATRSYFFAEMPSPPAWLPPPARPATQSPAPLRPGGHTRVKPPGDVIRLEDRLRYVLQPPLESLFDTRSLSFPCRPFSYQWQGIAFLYPRQAAVLADEMGLGKTMQAIVALRLLLHRGEIRTVLLVCPKPLVTNWQREFHLWAPEVPVLVIDGDQARRRWQWELAGVPVKLANYELLHRDREILEGISGRREGEPREGKAPAEPFGKTARAQTSDVFETSEVLGRGPAALHFDLVILDESQRVKNRSSATSQAAQALDRRRVWALTGTPVENSPEDLVGIFECLVPGHLSPEMSPRRIGRAVRDYVLRRTKDQVLTDLPPKLYRDAELELTPEQRQTYRLAEDEGVLRLTEMGHEVTIQHVFELVLRLKQICNFDPATGTSAKLERLEADLEEVAASGRKALVFSQWVDTIRRLSRYMERFGALEFHGQVSPREREAVLRQFREDPRRHVLLVTYGAGGVGLNLQMASYVFLFDRWWNPAVEDQAINRAHRIGCSGPVTVTRFLMLDSIEERIERILQEKRDLFDTIFSAGVGQRPKLGLTQQEIFGLFDLKCPTGPLDAAA
jgi:SNF2 family DNA or RNA helicase